jgi:hypothetical protein
MDDPISLSMDFYIKCCTCNNISTKLVIHPFMLLSRELSKEYCCHNMIVAHWNDEVLKWKNQEKEKVI